MKQKIFTSVAILVITGLLAGIVIGSNKNRGNTKPNEFSGTSGLSDNNRSIIFYYSDTCPHCADVEKWIEDNKIEEKVEIVRKEVGGNRDNFLEFNRIAENCNLVSDTIGVPFLYTPEGKCLIGTTDIISYLSDKARLPTNSNEQSGQGE